MGSAERKPTNITVRQFVADSGAITRGLRAGHGYVLTLHGEPLARLVPIRRRRSVPKHEALAIFASAPVIDVDQLRADLDDTVDQELHDPYGDA
jgi:antitoxin (DNA-binding transcriptional repressor) of toxin-antitoxin stability system